MDVEVQTTKRKREPNFTPEEKVLLSDLVKKKKDVVECKLTDTQTVRLKKAAWNDIAAEFNARHLLQKRDTITLKTAWDNIKMLTRRAKDLDPWSYIQRTVLRPKWAPIKRARVCDDEISPLTLQTMVMEVLNPVSPASEVLSIKSEPRSPDYVMAEPTYDIQVEIEQDDEDHSPATPVPNPPINNRIIKNEEVTADIPEREYKRPLRKTACLARRDAMWRRELAAKNMNLKILRLKLDTERKKNKTAQYLLESAKVELEFQRSRLLKIIQ